MSALEWEMALLLREAGLPEPEREHRFHATRRWRLDFAWPEALVALEVEGGTWTGGRHTTGVGFESDCEKYGEAALAGWLVIRANNHMVSDGRALALVRRALSMRAAHDDEASRGGATR